MKRVTSGSAHIAAIAGKSSTPWPRSVRRGDRRMGAIAGRGGLSGIGFILLDDASTMPAPGRIATAPARYAGTPVFFLENRAAQWPIYGRLVPARAGESGTRCHTATCPTP